MQTTILVCILLCQVDNDPEFEKLRELEKHVHARKVAIKELMEAVENPVGHYDKWGAMSQLGVYRAGEACPLLVRNIEFHVSKTNDLDWLGLYPAAIALAKIGEPSVKEIIKNLNVPLSEKRFKLFAHTLNRFYGRDDRPVLLFRLEHEINLIPEKSKAYYAKKLSNLRKLIEFIETEESIAKTRDGNALLSEQNQRGQAESKGTLC